MGWLILIYLVLFFWLANRKILYGLFLIAAFPYSYLIRFSIVGVPSTLLEGMILVTVAVWAWQKRKNWRGVVVSALKAKKIPPPFQQWFWAVVLFLIAATISVYISSAPRAAWGVWKAYFAEPILLFAVFISAIKTKEETKKLVWALVLGAAPLALFSVIQKFTGWLISNPFWQAEATRRVTGFFNYPNAVALYLAPLVPFIVYLVFREKKNRRNFHYLALGLLFFLFLAAVYFTRSLGAFLALAAAFSLFGLLGKKTRLATAVLLVLAALFIWASPLKEPLAKEMMFREVSGQIRLNMWGETVEMLKSHPLFGAGLAGFQKTVEPYHILQWAEIYLYPHNLFLNFWSETGVSGLAAFLWLAVLFFSNGAGLIKKNAIQKNGGTDIFLVEALLASLIIILIQGLVDVPYFKNDLSVLFWLLLGLMAVNLKNA